jgi:hypothetical protein
MLYLTHTHVTNEGRESLLIRTLTGSEGEGLCLDIDLSDGHEACFTLEECEVREIMDWLSRKFPAPYNTKPGAADGCRNSEMEDLP